MIRLPTSLLLAALPLSALPLIAVACNDSGAAWDPDPSTGATTTTTTGIAGGGTGGSGTGGAATGGNATGGSATGGAATGGAATGGSATGGAATGGEGSGGDAGAGGAGGSGPSCLPSTAVMINEVRYDPPNNDNGYEWVELYNASAHAVDISGWTLEGGTTNTYNVIFTFPPSTSIASHDYVVVGGSQVGAADFHPPAALNMGNGSNPDAVRIRDEGAVVIDTVIYGPAGNNPDGWVDDCGQVATVYAPDGFSSQTIARSPNGTDTNDSSVDFVATNTITLGAANP